ncbi:MAG: M48 family metalloprotease [Flavobacteriaceae bacterium]|nr:M48 family metalloprotease [Flavobacteriaceae bacterium]
MKRLHTLCFYLLFFVLYLCGTTALWGQKPVLIDTLSLSQKKELQDKYTTQKKEFYTVLGQKYKSKELKEIKNYFDENYATIEKRIEKNELLENSPFNTYLNNLVNQIQAKNPEIPKDLTILASREYETNAYNLGEGTIIVNQYLLETLDNEDQLVFTLCHEIAHQKMQHVLNAIYEQITLNNSKELKKKTKALKKQRYKQKISADDLLTELKYKKSETSRIKEMQADSLGYIYYSKLGRSPEQVARTLENLRDSDKEKDSLLVKDYKTIFASLKIPFKDKWFEMENFDLYHYQKNNKFNTDSLRTHPNCDIRIDMLNKIDTKVKSNSIKKVVGKSPEFTQWKESAVYQNILNEYMMKHYGNSLYEALKQYKSTPNELLKKWIAANFKKLYEAKKSYTLNRYVSQVNVSKYTNSYNQFSSFIYNISLEDLESISTKIK